MKNLLSGLSFLLAISFFIVAHSKSDFSEERKKPNSLVYYKDVDAGKTYWLTYDKQVDEWTQKFLGENPENATKYLDEAAYSKYGISYTYAAESPDRQIPDFEVILDEDTIINNLRNIRFTIIPKRNVNKIDLYSAEDISFHSLEFNGKKASVTDSTKLYRGTKNSALIRYYVSNNDSLKVKFTAV